MITAMLTVFVVLSLAGLIIVMVAAHRAPIGYEDAAGFHAIESRARPEPVLGVTIRAH